MISYEKAPDVEATADQIISALALNYVDTSRLYFYRSKGSKSKRVQARIHGMGRIWFDALSMRPQYIIEVISEEFDKLAQPEREKVIIHELMHIPSRFSGGFVPHKGKVNTKSVEKMYLEYTKKIGAASQFKDTPITLARP